MDGKSRGSRESAGGLSDRIFQTEYVFFSSQISRKFPRNWLASVCPTCHHLHSCGSTQLNLSASASSVRVLQKTSPPRQRSNRPMMVDVTEDRNSKTPKHGVKFCTPASALPPLSNQTQTQVDQHSAHTTEHNTSDHDVCTSLCCDLCLGALLGPAPIEEDGQVVVVVQLFNIHLSHHPPTSGGVRRREATSCDDGHADRPGHLSCQAYEVQLAGRTLLGCSTPSPTHAAYGNQPRLVVSS